MLIAFSERQHKSILQHLRKERWGRNAAQHGRRRSQQDEQQGPTQAEQALASVVRLPAFLPSCLMQAAPLHLHLCCMQCTCQ